MGKDINQIATAATSVLSTDKMYLGRSPFGATDDRYILGSSLITQFGRSFVTVGAGGSYNYTSIGAAIAAGNYNIYVATGVAESADVNIGSNGDYHIVCGPNASSNFSSGGSEYKFNILNGTTANLHLYNPVFLFSYTSAKNFITYTGTGAGNIYCINYSILNTSTADQCFVNGLPASAGYRQQFINGNVNLPNQADGGIQIAGGSSSGMRFTSGGANCAGALNASRALINGIQFSGSTWNASTVATFISSQVNGVFVSSESGTPLVRIDEWSDCVLSDVTAEGTSGIRVVLLGPSVLTGFNLGNLGSYFPGFSSGSCSISNGTTPQGDLTTSGAQMKVSNVRFTSGDFTVQAYGALLSNIDCDAGCVVDTDNISIQNINCGASGGAANTVTLAAGAENCSIKNANVEIAIIDNSGNATNSYDYKLWV